MEGGFGRVTCLPIMPIQAIDGVVMVSTGEEEEQVRWFRDVSLMRGPRG